MRKFVGYQSLLLAQALFLLYRHYQIKVDLASQALEMEGHHDFFKKEYREANEKLQQVDDLLKAVKSKLLYDGGSKMKRIFEEELMMMYELEKKGLI